MTWCGLSSRIDCGIMLGLRGTYKAIRTANGPAQHISCAIVGLTYAGMFAGMVPGPILVAWAATSVMIIAAVVWLPKLVLKYTLLADFVFSAMVLTFYFMHDPKPQGYVYYTAGNMTRGHAPQMSSMTMMEMLSHSVAVIVMASWALYLSNLVSRQILERKRFDARA